MIFSYKTLICDLGTSSVSLPLCKLGKTFALDIPDNSDSSISTGNLPLILNVWVLTDKIQLFCIHKHNQPATNVFLFFVPLFGRKLPWWGQV